MKARIQQDLEFWDEEIEKRRIRVPDPIISSNRGNSVFPPGDTIEDILTEKGWTKAQFAARAGFSLEFVDELIEGREGITAEIASRLSWVLGSTANFWLTREAQYRSAMPCSVVVITWKFEDRELELTYGRPNSIDVWFRSPTFDYHAGVSTLQDLPQFAIWLFDGKFGNE